MISSENTYIARLLPVPHWRKPLLHLTLGLLAIIVAYFETVTSVASIWWRSGIFAHGMFVVPFTLYMIWIKRELLARLHPVTCWWGVVLLLPSVLLWMFGVAGNISGFQHLALLGIIWAIILTVLGKQVVRTILYPLGFLIFAVPLGEEIIPLLMEITAVFTVKALILSGFPVYQEGMFISIPSGNFEVAKACSGIRYLYASFALGYVYAYLNYKSVWRRVVFIVISILLPIVANGLRAYGIILIAHFSEMKYATGADHIIYGWLFFGVIMFMLFFIGSRWQENIKSPGNNNFVVKINSSETQKVVTVLFLVLLLLGPSSSLWIHKRGERAVTSLLPIPQSNGEWRVLNSTELSWAPDFKGASHAINTAYTNGQDVIKLYIAYYANESQGNELINQNNHLYDRQWTQIQLGQRRIAIQDIGEVTLQQVILSSQQKQRILWYWYDLSGNTTPDIYMAKLIQAGTRLLGSDQGGMVVALLSEVKEERQPVLESINSFMNVMYPAIQSSIAKVREIQD